MGSDNRQKLSPSPPPLAPAPSLPTSTRVGGIPRPAGPRIRPKSGGRRSHHHHPSRPFKDECYSAVLPILVIAAVWCLGCYIYLWISLYQSFSEDVGEHNADHNIEGVFNKKNDILAIKLEHFLAGKDFIEQELGESSGSTSTGNGVSSHGASRSINIDTLPVMANNIDSTLLEQVLTDPIIARQIQSTLVAQTGYPNLILGAYMEPPLPLEELNGDSIERMKLRTHTPQNLTHASYPYGHTNAQTKSNSNGNQLKEAMPGACSQNGAQWTFPTFHPKSSDSFFESNVFKKRPNFDKRWELALGIKDGTDNHSHNDDKGHCPVDADPFLPWIHDAFPSNDGGHIEFIISNKRRCNTDPSTFQSDLKNLEPQVALMQPIPVRRMKDEEEGKFGDVLEKLWSPISSNAKQGSNQLNHSYILTNITNSAPRYILGTSLADGDEDGKYTRFICRFHTLTTDKDGDETLLKVELGETLSTYPYNPEHANYRKRGSKPMLTSLEQGHDEQLWNSVYTVRCPAPRLSDKNDKANHGILASIIASGKSVVQGTPLLYLDLIPIRTPTRRYREGFALPGVSASASSGSPPFDPKLTWGDSHILPRVEASGRWTNIPICRPPKVDEGLARGLADAAAATAKSVVQKDIASIIAPGNAQNKTHFLVGCVWASRSYPTRGQKADTDSSTSDRLREFLAYHTQIAGFDHVYVYDNSDTGEGNATLKPVTDLFSPHDVTRIPWPHRVCNNNRPMHANPGERSSQYAAENSCRARYGPDTTWMASLDVDEYLVPTGKEWKNLRHWLEHVTSHEESTQILSFFQTRALPSVDLMIPYDGSSTRSCKVDKAGDSNIDAKLKSMCLMKDPDKTFMETYNCEPTTHPKPEAWAWRAKKQIYRPDFVLNHFVHYSVVTRQILDKPLEASLRFYERAPFERRVNELTEGFLLHTKTSGPEMTSKWHEICTRKGLGSNKNCKVGIASTKLLGGEEKAVASGADDITVSNAFESNCYPHSRVMNEWVPKLEEVLLSLNKH